MRGWRLQVLTLGVLLFGAVRRCHDPASDASHRASDPTTGGAGAGGAGRCAEPAVPADGAAVGAIFTPGGFLGASGCCLQPAATVRASRAGSPAWVSCRLVVSAGVRRDGGAAGGQHHGGAGGVGQAGRLAPAGCGGHPARRCVWLSRVPAAFLTCASAYAWLECFRV